MRAVLCVLVAAAVAVSAINVKTMQQQALAADADTDAEALVDVSNTNAALAFGQFHISAESYSAFAGAVACVNGAPKGSLCIDHNSFSCAGGKFVSGKCKGDSSVMCCVGGQPTQIRNVDLTAPPGSKLPTSPFPAKTPPPQPPLPADHAVSFKATLTPAGITTLNNLCNKVLQKQLKQPVLIPDQTLTMNTPQLGTFTLVTKNLVLSELRSGPVSLVVKPPHTVSANLVGGNAVANFDFTWSRTAFPRLSGDGHLMVAVTDLSVAIALSVSSVNSKLAVSMTSCSVNFDKLNFKFSNSWDSWVLNSISTLFMSKLKPLIQQKVASGVIAPFNEQIGTILNSLPTTNSFAAGSMSCTLRLGFETVVADANGLTFGESFAIDCN